MLGETFRDSLHKNFLHAHRVITAIYFGRGGRGLGEKKTQQAPNRTLPPDLEPAFLPKRSEIGAAPWPRRTARRRQLDAGSKRAKKLRHRWPGRARSGAAQHASPWKIVKEITVAVGYIRRWQAGGRRVGRRRT